MAALLSMHAVLALLLAVSASLAAGAALEALMEEALEALHVREVRLRAPGAPPSSPNNFPYAVAPLPLGVVRTDSTSAGLQIVGGKDAAPGQFPWMVSMQVMIPSQLWLGSQPQHICGGSLVAPGWVLTAAHCVWGVPQSSLRVDVVLGITNLALVSTTEGAQRITVTRMFAHGKYDHYARRGVGPNDIAVLKLARKATLSDTVKLVPLATGRDQSGAATLSGWGSTSQDGSNPKYPNKLQTAEFPIVAYKDCIDFVNKTDPSAVELLADTNLCVGPLDATGLSSCSGDSGGPLVLEINGQTMQVGVVSWGLVNCGSFPFPSVFTRVSAHYNWVSAVQRKFQD